MDFCHKLNSLPWSRLSSVEDALPLITEHLWGLHEFSAAVSSCGYFGTLNFSLDRGGRLREDLIVGIAVKVWLDYRQVMATHTALKYLKNDVSKWAVPAKNNIFRVPFCKRDISDSSEAFCFLSVLFNPVCYARTEVACFHTNRIEYSTSVVFCEVHCASLRPISPNLKRFDVQPVATFCKPAQHFLLKQDMLHACIRNCCNIQRIRNSSDFNNQPTCVELQYHWEQQLGAALTPIQGRICEPGWKK